MRVVSLLLLLVLAAPVRASAPAAPAKSAFQGFKERWRSKYPGGRWDKLGSKLAPSADAARRDPTAAEAKQMFSTMVASHIGYGFPDGLCMERAEVAAAAIARAGFHVEKVFVTRNHWKGRLDAPTANSESGHVNWSYHIAPAVRVNGKLMVLDPSLFDEPVLVATWMSKMNANTRTVIPGNQLWPGHHAASDEERGPQLGDALYQVAGGRQFERMRAAELKMSPAERAALYEDEVPLGNR